MQLEEFRGQLEHQYDTFVLSPKTWRQGLISGILAMILHGIVLAGRLL